MISTVSFVITCITAVISFVTLTVKLTRYITKAESRIDANTDELHSFEAGAERAHGEMWEAIDENGENIQRHELWIAKHDAREGREQEDLK
jgi:hypothetical protein